MKKWTSLIIAFLIFLNSAGYIVIFWELQQETKREMIQKIAGDIPENELTCITINKKEISVSEFREKDELEYKGSMYDVVNKKENDKYYTFYCVNDVKESQLIKNFGTHFDENKEKTNQNNSKILIPLIAPAVIRNDKIVKRIDFVLSLNNNFSFNYRSISPDTYTPPPRT